MPPWSFRDVSGTSLLLQQALASAGVINHGQALYEKRPSNYALRLSYEMKDEDVVHRRLYVTTVCPDLVRPGSPLSEDAKCGDLVTGYSEV